MKVEDCVLSELTEQITCRDVSYEDIGDSSSFIDQFHDKPN